MRKKISNRQYSQLMAYFILDFSHLIPATVINDLRNEEKHQDQLINIKPLYIRDGQYFHM